MQVDSLRRLKIVHHVGNPSFRKHLERLPVQSYTSVLILADEALEADSMHSDSASLACLLLLRHIQVRCWASPGGGGTRLRWALLSPLARVGHAVHRTLDAQSWPTANGATHGSASQALRAQPSGW